MLLKSPSMRAEIDDNLGAGMSATAGVNGPKKFACMACRTRKLKCDSIRPSCGTCSKGRQMCEYVEPSRRRVNKRRNISALEERLQTLEGRLAGYTMTTDQDANEHAEECGKSAKGLITFISKQPTFQAAPDPSVGSEMPSSNPDTPSGTNTTTSPGLDESLPDSNCIRELNEIYFDKVHPTIPILHKSRFLSGCVSSIASNQPALYLKYAIWTLAATLSDKYKSAEHEFYERARKYIQADEMADSGNGLMNIDHIRFWVIMSEYEVRKMLWNRAWSSTGHSIRLCQLIGLHCLDDVENPPKHHNLQDWADIEGGRRCFWTAFAMDRYSSVITGRPLCINEDDIFTNLPASESAFQNNLPQITDSFTAGRTLEVTRPISPLGVNVISAAMFGDLAHHMHKRDSETDQSDVLNGAFWKRHWSIDAKIVKLQIALPQMLRAGMGMEFEEGTVFGLCVVMQALVIGLYKAAALKAEKWQLEESIGRQCAARCAAASDEVVRSMKRADFKSINRWPTFANFCMHMAIDSLAQGMNDPYIEYQSRLGLETLLTIFRSLRTLDPFLRSLMASVQKGLKRSMIEFPDIEFQEADKVESRITTKQSLVAMSQYVAPSSRVAQFTEAPTRYPSNTQFDNSSQVQLDPAVQYDLGLGAMDVTDIGLIGAETNVDFDFDMAVLQDMQNFHPADLRIFGNT